MGARVDAERLRKPGADVWLTLFLVIWLTYSVTGFRNPTQPILLSDENAGSGIRQVLFAGTGLLAIRRLMFTGSLSQVVGLRAIELGIFLMLLGSCAWSTSPVLTIKRSLIFFFGMVSLITATHMARNPVQYMQRLLFGFTASVAWISLAGWFVLPRNCMENPARPGLAGLANHPNTLAPFLVLGFMVSLGFKAKGIKGLFQRIGQAGQFIGTVMTGSMTSLSLLVLCICWYIYLSTTDFRRGAVNMVVGACTALTIIIGPTRVRDMAFAAMGRDASLSGRDQLWARVIDEIGKSPIVGSGYGAFWVEGKGRELVQTWNPRQAHHAYLDVLTDLGFVGLIVVLIVFPLRSIVTWRRYCGEVGSERRRALSSLLAAGIGVMSSYAMAQSFYFKMDSFPFFFLFWAVLLLSNSDLNGVDREFEDEPQIPRHAALRT